VKQVAAAIARQGDRVLVTRRAPGQHLAGFWEFPGGKLEFAEAPEAGLAREVREELGIDVEVGEPFHVVNVSRTPESAVLVVFYWCRWTGGPIRLLDAADVAWVARDGFGAYRFLESNRPVVEKLNRQAG
jgi:8-oxo-dGTP diphosphatase